MQYCRDHKLPRYLADFTCKQLPCTVVHPRSGLSCAHNTASTLIAGFLLSMKLYTPLYTLITVMSRRSKLLQPSIAWLSLKHIAASSVRSSAFLGSYISIVWTTVCVMRNLLRDDRTIGPLLGSFLCGFSVLLERKDRRRELACYVLPRALQSFFTRMGVRSPVPGGDVLLFCAASAVFMAVYNHYTVVEAQASADADAMTGISSSESRSKRHEAQHAEAMLRKARMSSALFVIVRVLTHGWV